MGKKIVALNGSPRRNGNTAGLVREFLTEKKNNEYNA